MFRFQALRGFRFTSMKKFVLAIVLVSVFSGYAQAQRRKGRVAAEDYGELKRIYFNLYTDSIKPVLNYYVNVEGEYQNGLYRPLDTATITLTADAGRMQGNEWIVDNDSRRLENVTFTATAKANPSMQKRITVYLKKGRDEEDEKILRQPQGTGR